MAEMSKACIVVRLDGKVSFSLLGQVSASYPKTFSHFLFLVNSHGTKTLLSEIAFPFFLTHRFLLCPDCPVRFAIIRLVQSLFPPCNASMALSHLRPAPIVFDTNSVLIKPALHFFTGIDYKPTTMIHRYNTLRKT